MRYLIAVLIAGVWSFSSAKAEDDHDHKQDDKWHCEKKVDGKAVDLKDVKNRNDCKAKGGLWKKGHDHKKDKHDHGEGHSDNDGHDHD